MRIAIFQSFNFTIKTSETPSLLSADSPAHAGEISVFDKKALHPPAQIKSNGLQGRLPG